MTQGAAGLTGVSHMRVVLSNGAEMLSWLGMWRDQPFTASEERALGAVVPRIASRLALEQKLRFRGVTGFAALAASLDIVSDPVLMLSAAGRVVYANPGGVAQLDGDPNLVAQVYDHVRGRVPSPRVYGHTVLKGRGLHAHHVVVLRPYADPPDRLMAAQQWGLTATEQRVLGELLTGAANKEIALRLGCAPRTVEVHVGAILRKARCESRSQLLAAFRRR
jgi:DNA-binding CsgD family transcriptional regulator